METAEKSYNLSLPIGMINTIYNLINTTMTVKDGLPIMEAIRIQVETQEAEKKKKEELTQVAEQIAPKKKVKN